MKLAFLVNDLATEVPQYTTTCLALEAHQRGHEVWYLEPDAFAQGADDVASLHAVQPPKARYSSREDYLADLQDPERVRRERLVLDELDLLMLRSDPSQEIGRRPWAQHVGIMFGQIAAERGVLVLNDPHGLSKALTKLYFLQFPQEVRPATLVTRCRADVEQFIQQHGGTAVIKPLQGSGGQGVFFVREEANLNQIFDAVSRDGYLIVQEYLRAAEKGDVRLFLVNGVPMTERGKYAAFARIHTGKDLRSNMHAGGKAEKVKVTDQMLALAEAVRPKLVRDGMFFVGLDVAGDKLMEINVFSPGGLSSTSKLTGVNFIARMVDLLERKLDYSRHDRKIPNVELAML